MKKIIILVLYKCSLNDSVSLKSILECNSALSVNDKLCIWDNSPDAQPASELMQLSNTLNCGLEYKHTPQNISLSAIYNNVINAHKEFDFLILLDQDSAFSKDYFNEFHLARQNNPDVNLFMPLIETSGKIVSPGSFYAYKGKYWDKKQYGKLSSQNNTAISSGMIINMSVFPTIGLFDEHLVLYGIDTNFMLRYRKYYNCFFVLKVKFEHDLSDFNNESTNTKIRRFKDLKKSALINAKLFPFSVRLLTFSFYLFKSLQYTLKYRTARFLN